MINVPPGTRDIDLTLEQLRFLHRHIRHEMDGSEKWDAPPANHELNTKIVEAILLCIESDELDASKVTAPLTLGYRDCLAIDYFSAALQDATGLDNGKMGEDILMKVFVARRDIARPWPIAEAQDEGPVFSDVKHKMEAFTNASTDDHSNTNHSGN